MIRQGDKWIDLPGTNHLESGNAIKFIKLPEMKLVQGKLLHLGIFTFLLHVEICDYSKSSYL